MAEVVSIKQKNVIPRSQTPEVDANIEYARKWYATKTWLVGMRIKLTEAGGQLGSIPKGCLTISFKPHLKSKGAHIAESISTATNYRVFMDELEDLYQRIYGYAQKFV